MPLYNLTEKFELGGSIEKVFQYFIDTEQISRSLSPSLKFQIIRKTSRYLSQGFSMEFYVHLFHLQTHWKSYIHSFSLNRHITCVWQKSSFFSWEHDCYFEPLLGNQTRITECLLYRLPFSPLGSFMNRLWIRPYLQHLFSYHRSRLIDAFQPSQNTEPPKSNTHLGTQNGAYFLPLKSRNS